MAQREACRLNSKPEDPKDFTIPTASPVQIFVAMPHRNNARRVLLELLRNPSRTDLRAG